MKISPLLVALVLIASRLLGAAPDSVGDFVYSETTRVGRDSFSRAYVLGTDGRFTGLYQHIRTGSSIVATASTLDHNGTYSYRRIDGSTAELVFSDDTNTPPVTRTLRFESDTGGSAIASRTNQVLGGSFSLASMRVNAPLLNSSNRSFVRAGGTAYSGFVLSSFSVVLIRAVGPGLTAFGVRGALRDPQLAIVAAGFNGVVATVDDRTPQSALAIRRVGAMLGAFPLVENSKDSAIIMQLRPGAYIAQASSVEPAEEGEVLIEVYLLP
jgi:hypothetical protein